MSKNSKSKKPGKSSQPSTVSKFINNQKDDQKDDPDESLKYFKSIKSTMKNTQPTSTQSSSAVLGFFNKESDSPKKIAKKKSPKRATRKPSTRKKNQDIRKLLSKDEQLIHKVLEASCRENDLDPYDVQMAIALSESMKEQPSAKENLKKFENPFASGGKVQSVTAVLERFGFKTGRALSEFEQEILASSKFSKRSKFQKAPTLLTRTSKEDRDEMIQNRIFKIVDQETLSDDIEQVSIDFDIYSSHLRDFHMQINSIASLENSTEPCDDVIQKYYVTELFQPSFLQPDYLLKDWNQIPGRDRSPRKGHQKEIEEDFMDDEKLNEDPKIDSQKKEEPSSLNSSCSDIFADVESFKIDHCVEDISQVSQQLDILHEKLSKTDLTMDVDEETIKEDENDAKCEEIKDEQHPVSEIEDSADKNQYSETLITSSELKTSTKVNSDNLLEIKPLECVDLNSSTDSELTELEDYFKIAETTSNDIKYPENEPNVDLTLNESAEKELKDLEDYFLIASTSSDLKQPGNRSEINLTMSEPPSTSMNDKTSNGNEISLPNVILDIEKSSDVSQNIQQAPNNSQVPIEIDLTLGFSDESSILSRKSSKMSIISIKNLEKSRISSNASINNDTDDTIEYEVPSIPAYKESQLVKPESPIKIDSSGDDEEVFDLTQREKLPEKNLDGEICDLTQEEGGNCEEFDEKVPHKSQEEFDQEDFPENSQNFSQASQNSQIDPQNASQLSQASQNSSSELEVIDISDDEINYSMQAFNEENFEPQNEEFEIEIENLESDENSPVNNYEDLDFRNLLNETTELLKTPMVTPRESLQSNQSTKKFLAAENLSDSIQEIIKKYGGEKSETPKRSSFRKYQSESSIKLNDSGKSVVDLTRDQNNFVDLTQNEEEIFEELENEFYGIENSQEAPGSQNVPCEDPELDLENILESSVDKSLANIINSPAVPRPRKSQSNRRKSRKSLLIASNEKYEIDTENFIPEPDFKSMTPAELKKELFKYGIRPLPVKKAVELLQHIYNNLNPKIRVAAEEEIDTNDSRMDLNQTDIVSNIACTGEDDDFVFQYGEIEGEEFILPKMRKSKIPTCLVPLQIAFYNMIRSNPQLQKYILEFRPLDLDMIHKHFRKFGLSFQLNDIIAFLDKRCITFKTKDQSYSKTHEAKKQKRLKRSQKN